MRGLEFRAWNTRTKKMEYITDFYWFEENFCHHNGDGDYIIQQYTGMNDADGNKIFEGDFLEDEQGMCTRVSFKGGSFVIEFGYGSTCTLASLAAFNTVIGNIYETYHPL